MRRRGNILQTVFRQITHSIIRTSSPEARL